MTETVLMCTVGGSHQPIITAIRETRPRFVCFVCTGRDPTTGQPGSEIQIIGKGHVIKAHPGDRAPTLPNIPTQAGLAEDQFELCVVPADDLDQAYGTIDAAVRDLKRRFPDALRIADYTGGTKTMTAALVMAALETEGVELKLVTGARADLIKVRNGTETSVSASAERLRLTRAMAPYLAAWHRHAYGEASEGLRAIAMPRSRELRGDLQIARDLSWAFDAWDRFDHEAAKERLSIYQSRVGKALSLHFTFLKLLTSRDDDRREPARLWDLWRNAERRAVQGRYDDAAARVYRLLEWTAQWLLRARKNLDTADLPAESVSEDVRVTRDREGRIQAGLLAAWDLVARHLHTEAAQFARAERDRLRDHIQMRNGSILAHGYTPVDRSAWERLARWVTDAFLPVLASEAGRAGMRLTPPQLPDRAMIGCPPDAGNIG